MNIDAHRVAPKLWIGSAPTTAVCRHFDVVVLCAEEVQKLQLPCKVLRVPLDDAKPSPEEIRLALKAGQVVNRLRHQGKRVLVTCAQGVNRSSLVAALALMADGRTAADAIHRIRTRRRPPIGMTPLSNPHFLQLLQRVEQRRAA